MEQVLNPLLYSQVQARFGAVLISNQGLPAEITYYREGDRLRVEAKHGEYYRVNCPKCGDTRQRLYISYLFGTFDPKTKSRLWHCAVCYNCNRTAKDMYLDDLVKEHFGKMKVLVPSRPVTEVVDPQEVRPPIGQHALLHDLPSTHPARAYLEGRGYDCNELGQRYYWMYYHDCDEYFLARRIFIPVLHERKDGALVMVGYQSRAIPGLSVADKPKYWTMPGFPKSYVLYNLHNARKHSRIILTEGVTDAARVGDNAVAMLGKSLSRFQINLLLMRCRHARLGVMLDSDAYSVGVSIVRQFDETGIFPGQRLQGGAFVVRLKQSDPGDYSREWLERLIDHADNVSRATKNGEVQA